MTSYQNVLDHAVAAGDVPFALALAGTSNGVTWMGSNGVAQDALFRAFSMTKGIGSLAAMILVERGTLELDKHVEAYMPEFAKLKVLDGFDSDTPLLRAPATKATVRHLLTHQSGLEYEHWNTDIAKYRKLTGQPRIGSGLREGLNYPLAFDPGTRWGYGIGIDWLGQVIEAVDGRPIDRFCREEILLPLGMTDTVFDLIPDIAPRLAPMKSRGANGFEDSPLSPPIDPEFYGMGQCLFTTGTDYMRFLRMILRGGELDGATILGRDTLAMMLTPQTGLLPKGLLRTANPRGSADFDPFPDAPLTHSLGFMRVQDDIPGMRHAGSQGWAGFANTHYWFDPCNDVAGIFMTQLIPFADPGAMAAYQAFEKAVYAQ